MTPSPVFGILVVMKRAIVTSLAVAVVTAPLAGAYGREMRGPIMGKRVQMRGPVQGRRAPLRGPVQGRRAPQRQAVFTSNTFSQSYNAQSKNAYTRTGAELYEDVSKGFNYYQKNQQWNVNARWGQYEYNDRVNTNLYRINR